MNDDDVCIIIIDYVLLIIVVSYSNWNHVQDAKIPPIQATPLYVNYQCRNNDDYDDNHAYVVVH